MIHVNPRKYLLWRYENKLKLCFMHSVSFCMIWNVRASQNHIQPTIQVEALNPTPNDFKGRKQQNKQSKLVTTSLTHSFHHLASSLISAWKMPGRLRVLLLEVSKFTASAQRNVAAQALIAASREMASTPPCNSCGVVSAWFGEMCCGTRDEVRFRSSNDDLDIPWFINICCSKAWKNADVTLNVLS